MYSYNDFVNSAEPPIFEGIKSSDKCSLDKNMPVSVLLMILIIYLVITTLKVASTRTHPSHE